MQLYKLTMHPALNYRQSRRSACDRCRGFKLRCERDQVNGRSCERCLKAQVVCTTNIGQPAPNFLRSKDPACSMTRNCDGLLLSQNRLSMAALRKTSNSKVRKPMLPVSSRKQDNPRMSNWQSTDGYPHVTSGAFPPFGEDTFRQLPSQSDPIDLFPTWGDVYGHWSGDASARVGH